MTTGSNLLTAIAGSLLLPPRRQLLPSKIVYSRASIASLIPDAVYFRLPMPLLSFGVTSLRPRLRSKLLVFVARMPPGLNYFFGLFSAEHVSLITSFVELWPSIRHSLRLTVFLTVSIFILSTFSLLFGITPWVLVAISLDARLAAKSWRGFWLSVENLLTLELAVADGFLSPDFIFLIIRLSCGMVSTFSLKSSRWLMNCCWICCNCWWLLLLLWSMIWSMIDFLLTTLN